MNNIILHGLKSNYKGLIGWMFGITIWTVIVLAMFPTFIEAGDAFLEVLKSYPPELLKAIGFTEEAFNSFEGFYGYIATYSYLIIAMYASYLGVKLFAEDNKLKTNDFLYTKPIGRTKVFVSKFLTGIYLLTIFVTTYIIFIQVSAYSFFKVDTDFDILLKMDLSLIGIVLFIYLFSMLVGTVYTSIRSYISIAMPITLLFFLLDLVGTLIDKPIISYITPFGMFNKSLILTEGNYEVKYIIVGILLMFIFIIVSFVKEKTKDVRG